MELLCLVEPLPFGEQSEELPSRTVLENEVELSLVLKGGMYLNEEGVVDFSEDIPLGHDPLSLILLLNIFLLHRF